MTTDVVDCGVHGAEVLIIETQMSTRAAAEQLPPGTQSQYRTRQFRRAEDNQPLHIHNFLEDEYI
ncbi:hypothetical protein ACQP0C_18000 [Nocardia sp. CA-129566]|uniref:hypothetical protein n=1 Tax=Nocardia sp. CA-129566 TaxID=3239976 RepID=UPI003D965684